MSVIFGAHLAYNKTQIILCKQVVIAHIHRMKIIKYLRLHLIIKAVPTGYPHMVSYMNA